MAAPRSSVLTPVDEPPPAKPKARPAAIAERYRGPLVLAGLTALALAIYLPYALKAGWYYDDWSLYSGFRDAGSSWGSEFSQCTATLPGGRSLTCLYHVTEYNLLTDHRTLYHLVSIAFLIAMGGLLYAVLRRCRMPWQWAALVAGLLVVFPASDATRLWPTGAIGQYVIVLELIGVLLTLSALGREDVRWRWALHGLSAVVFVLAMSSYEIVVPLVALNGIAYWAAYRNRPAIRRGAFDLALAILFVGYRLVVNPADPSEGFTVHRTLSGDFSRAWTLVSDAWKTWHETFLPGAVGTVGIIVVLLLAAYLFLREPETRRRLTPWAFLLGAGLVASFASTFVFFTANDLYVPQLFTLFNRVTLPGSIPYVCMFVALLGIGYELVRRFGAARWVAVAAVALVAAASVWHQLRISTEHKRSWEASWTTQSAALEGYARATEGLPRESRVIGFGVPMWEQGFIPVFAATWDLRGALDYTTAVDPPAASPLTPTMFCGRRGMVLDGVPFTPYLVSGQPLYFLDAAAGEAVLISDQEKCRAGVARWGRPPYFAGEATG